MELIESGVAGARKTTCKEAVKLLNEGKIRKAWFRPNGKITPNDPEGDLCYVWYIEEEKK